MTETWDDIRAEGAYCSAQERADDLCDTIARLVDMLQVYGDRYARQAAALRSARDTAGLNRLAEIGWETVANMSDVRRIAGQAAKVRKARADRRGGVS